MADIFSDEWLKSPISAKKKSFSSTSSLENLYVLVYVNNDALKEKCEYEINELGLSALVCRDLVEIKKVLNRYGSKIVLVISSIELSEADGKSARLLVLENTNDTPYVILTDLNPFEIDNSNNITEMGYDLTPHTYLATSFPSDVWHNFLRFDVLTRISLLGEEVKLRGAFVQNAANIIQQTEELVLSLEENPESLVILDSIFGNIHTLKGGSSFLQPKNLERFMHKFEDLINQMRSRELPMTSEVITSMLAVLDKSKELIDDLSAELHHEYEEEELAAYFDEFGSGNAHAVIHSISELVPDSKTNPIVSSGLSDSLETPSATHDASLSNMSSVSSSESPSGIVSSSAPPASSPPSTLNRRKDDKSLKVPISLLDTLMHISGELTVVRNMINKIDRSLKVKYTGDRELERMSGLLEELHKLNGSLQTHILDLRKVPVKDIVAPLNRVVRDLSKQLDKIVTLKVQGSELRIDTAIAEILNNTLIHIVRNSIDHGLESTAERRSKGKPPGGSLYIEAFEENDNVYVRIRDDGRGLQTERIRSRAIERGLLTEAQAQALKEEDIWPLIFAPGFSTAEKVTDISGRGIGMSAVKEAVEAIDGEVEIASVSGEGSSITLSMPLPKSVLITRCLFIQISGMQLGVPNENVYRIVHMDGETDTTQLTKIEDTYVLSLEDELIPVVQLDQILGTSKMELDDAKVKTIAVLRSSKGAALGIVVNDVLEFEDAVVKPFTDHLKAFDIFFGTTFLGDGSIGLIFSVDGLVETYRAKQFYRFNINFKSREHSFQEVAAG